jgi:hypothetical protein
VLNCTLALLLWASAEDKELEKDTETWLVGGAWLVARADRLISKNLNNCDAMLELTAFNSD